MDTTKLVTLATQPFSDPEDLYYVVDFLNRALKEKGIVVGLSKSKEEGSLQVTVYEEVEEEH